MLDLLYNTHDLPVGEIELSFSMCKEKEMKRRRKAKRERAAGSLGVFSPLGALIVQQQLLPLAGLDLLEAVLKQFHNPTLALH